MDAFGYQLFDTANGRGYVRDSDLDAFMQQNPDAQKLNTFVMSDKSLVNVREQDVDAFKKQNGGAQRVVAWNYNGEDFEQTEDWQKQWVQGEALRLLGDAGGKGSKSDNSALYRAAQIKQGLDPAQEEKNAKAVADKAYAEYDDFTRRFHKELGLQENWVNPDAPADEEHGWSAMPDDIRNGPRQERARWMTDQLKKTGIEVEDRGDGTGLVVNRRTGETLADKAGNQYVARKNSHGVWQYKDEDGIYRNADGGGALDKNETDFDGIDPQIAPFLVNEAPVITGRTTAKLLDENRDAPIRIRGFEQHQEALAPEMGWRGARDMIDAQDKAAKRDALRAALRENYARLTSGEETDWRRSLKNIAENAADYLPFSPTEMIRLGEAAAIAQRINDGGEATEDEQLFLQKFLSDREVSAKLRTTVGANTIESLASLPAFMAEMAVGGAIEKALVKKAATTAAGKWVSRQVAKEGIARIAAKGIENLVVKPTLQMAITPTRWIGGTLDRAAPVGEVAVGDDGRTSIRNLRVATSDEWWDALKNSLADNYIEYLSESSGEILGAGMKKWSAGWLAKASRAGGYKRFLGHLAQKALGASDEAIFGAGSKALSAAAYDGIVYEWAEERIGGFLRGLFGVDQDEEAATRSRLMNAWKGAGYANGWDDALVEIATLLTPAGIGAGANTAQRAAAAARLRLGVMAQGREAGRMFGNMANLGLMSTEGAKFASPVTVGADGRVENYQPFDLAATGKMRIDTLDGEAVYVDTDGRAHSLTDAANMAATGDGRAALWLSRLDQYLAPGIRFIEQQQARGGKATPQDEAIIRAHEFIGVALRAEARVNAERNGEDSDSDGFAWNAGVQNEQLARLMASNRPANAEDTRTSAQRAQDMLSAAGEAVSGGEINVSPDAARAAGEEARDRAAAEQAAAEAERMNAASEKFFAALNELGMRGALTGPAKVSALVEASVDARIAPAIAYDAMARSGVPVEWLDSSFGRMYPDFNLRHSQYNRVAAARASHNIGMRGADAIMSDKNKSDAEKDKELVGIVAQGVVGGVADERIESGLEKLGIDESRRGRIIGNAKVEAERLNAEEARTVGVRADRVAAAASEARARMAGQATAKAAATEAAPAAGASSDTTPVTAAPAPAPAATPAGISAPAEAAAPSGADEEAARRDRAISADYADEAKAQLPAAREEMRRVEEQVDAARKASSPTAQTAPAPAANDVDNFMDREFGEEEGEAPAAQPAATERDSAPAAQPAAPVRQSLSIPVTGAQGSAPSGAIPADVVRTAEAVSRVLPGIEIRYVRDISDAGDNERLRDAPDQGNASGAFLPNPDGKGGTVFILPGATATTVMHEGAFHAAYSWAKNAAKREGKEAEAARRILATMREYARTAPLYVKGFVAKYYGAEIVRIQREGVEGNKTARQINAEVEDMLIDELCANWGEIQNAPQIIAAARGLDAAAKRDAEGFFARMGRAVSDMFRAMLRALGFGKKYQLFSDSSKAIEAMVRDFLAGKDIGGIAADFAGRPATGRGETADAMSGWRLTDKDVEVAREVYEASRRAEVERARAAREEAARIEREKAAREAAEEKARRDKAEADRIGSLRGGQQRTGAEPSGVTRGERERRAAASELGAQARATAEEALAQAAQRRAEAEEARRAEEREEAARDAELLEEEDSTGVAAQASRAAALEAARRDKLARRLAVLYGRVRSGINTERDNAEIVRIEDELKGVKAPAETARPAQAAQEPSAESKLMGIADADYDEAMAEYHDYLRGQIRAALDGLGPMLRRRKPIEAELDSWDEAVRRGNGFAANNALRRMDTIREQLDALPEYIKRKAAIANAINTLDAGIADLNERINRAAIDRAAAESASREDAAALRPAAPAPTAEVLAGNVQAPVVAEEAPADTEAPAQTEAEKKEALRAKRAANLRKNMYMRGNTAVRDYAAAHPGSRIAQWLEINTNGPFSVPTSDDPLYDWYNNLSDAKNGGKAMERDWKAFSHFLFDSKKTGTNDVRFGEVFQDIAVERDNNGVPTAEGVQAFLDGLYSEFNDALAAYDAKKGGGGVSRDGMSAEDRHYAEEGERERQMEADETASFDFPGLDGVRSAFEEVAGRNGIMLDDAGDRGDLILPEDVRRLPLNAGFYIGGEYFCYITGRDEDGTIRVHATSIGDGVDGGTEGEYVFTPTATGYELKEIGNDTRGNEAGTQGAGGGAVSGQEGGGARGGGEEAGSRADEEGGGGDGGFSLESVSADAIAREQKRREDRAAIEAERNKSMSAAPVNVQPQFDLGEANAAQGDLFAPVQDNVAKAEASVPATATAEQTTREQAGAQQKPQPPQESRDYSGLSGEALRSEREEVNDAIEYNRSVIEKNAGGKDDLLKRQEEFEKTGSKKLEKAIRRRDRISSEEAVGRVSLGKKWNGRIELTGYDSDSITFDFYRLDAETGEESGGVTFTVSAVDRDGKPVTAESEFEVSRDGGDASFARLPADVRNLAIDLINVGREIDRLSEDKWDPEELNSELDGYDRVIAESRDALASLEAEREAIDREIARRASAPAQVPDAWRKHADVLSAYGVNVNGIDFGKATEQDRRNLETMLGGALNIRNPRRLLRSPQITARLQRFIDALRDRQERNVAAEPIDEKERNRRRIIRQGNMAIAEEQAGEAGNEVPEMRMRMSRAVVTPEQDAAYMDAASRIAAARKEGREADAGDLESAQRMVDDVARRNGYTPSVVYHATKRTRKPWYVFEPMKGREANWKDAVRTPIFFAANKQFTTDLMVQMEEAKKNKPLTDKQTEKFLSNIRYINAYLNYGKTFDSTNPDDVNRLIAEAGALTAKEKHVLRIAAGMVDGWQSANNWVVLEGPTVQQYLKDNGYDSYIGMENFEKTIGIFDNKRIKSADPVTYDDAGEVIPLSQRFDAGKEDIRWSFAGGQGAANIGVGGLADAERMERDGADRLAIWRATGWWRGADNKWRVELPDIGTDIPRSMDGRTLGEMRGGDEGLDALLSAYPQIGETKVRFAAWDGDVAAYLPFSNTVVINTRKDGNERNRSAVMHELQHAIQYAEGFRLGSDQGGAYGEAGAGDTGAGHGSRSSGDIAREELLESIGESFARNFGDGARGPNAIPYALVSIRKIRDGIPGFSGMGYRERTGIVSFNAEMGRLARKNGYADAGAMADALFDSVFRDSPIGRYWLGDGEVEARAVQRRLGMSPEERASVPPWETETEERDPRSALDAMSGRRRYSFAGATGAARLGIGSLGDARQMERDGASRDDTWRNTGWWRGADGQWRVELPAIRLDVPREADGSTLGDLRGRDAGLDAVLAAYPNLADTRIVFMDMPGGAKAAYVRPGNAIVFSTDRENDYGQSTMLAHEIQHAIQDAEGFAAGANVRDFRDRPIEDERVRRSGLGLSNGVAAHYGRVPETMFDLSGSAILAMNALSLAEGGAEPGPGEEQRYRRARGLAEEVRRIAAENGYASAREMLGDVFNAAYEASREGQYLDSAGEVEARNAAMRDGMTDAERAATPPWETERAVAGRRSYMPPKASEGGMRWSLSGDTMKNIHSAIGQYKEAGVKFSPFTESVITMLNWGGKREIGLPGFETTRLVIESPKTAQGAERRLDLDHSALRHNWEAGRAYSGYYTWPEFDRAFRDYNLRNLQKLPNVHDGQETWQWTVKYPKTDAHDAYELTWRLVRDADTGKMLNLFTTRQTKDVPPPQIKTPEGEHSRQVRQEGVAVPSGSGVTADIVPQSPAEGQASAAEEDNRALMPPRASEGGVAAGRPRWSISNLYTGTAADYAERVPVLDKDGNVTGYRIDNGPSLLKIGTGEGAQAYGWGLYASNRRGVAEWYARNDKKKKEGDWRNGEYFIDGKRIPSYDAGLIVKDNATPRDIALNEYVYAKGDVQKALDGLSGNRDFPDYLKSKLMDAHLWLLKKENQNKLSAKVKQYNSNLYEQTFFTNRAEGDESHLLNWYEPVSGWQRELLEKALADNGVTVRRVTTGPGYNRGTRFEKDGKILVLTTDQNATLTGELAYQLLAKDEVLGSPKAASEWLAAHDIDGIKYPVDSYGKTVKDGDKAGWNYISFRDDNIRVDHKWRDGRMMFSKTTDAADGSSNSMANRGLDSRGIMTSTADNEKENGDELLVQGNRVSEQGDGGRMGSGESEGGGGDRILTDASAIARGVEGRTQTGSRVREREAESAARITEYAKENGVWHGDVEKEFDGIYGSDEEEEEKSTEGGEAIVWFDEKRRVAVKAIGLDYYGSPTLALERVELHNRYFPNTKLNVIGFGEVKDIVDENGEVSLYGRPFNIIVEQKLVNRTQELTKDEIRKRLEKRGFKFLKDRGSAGIDMETPDGKAVVSDLHERNVFGTINGDVHVIDCDIRLKPSANPAGMRLSKVVTPADATVRWTAPVETGSVNKVDSANGLWYNGDNGRRDTENGRPRQAGPDGAGADNEFRGLQEESRSTPPEVVSEYHSSKRAVDEGLRGRLARVLAQRVERGRRDGRDDVRVLKNEKTGADLRVGRVDGQTFHDIFEIVRTYLPNGDAVDLHDSYGDDVKCWLSEDGLSGFAVEPDGNIVSVFNFGRKGFLKTVFPLIREAGGTKLDCYKFPGPTNLPELYEKFFGFKPASVMAYDESFEPDDPSDERHGFGRRHGMPDIVFMVLPHIGRMVEERRFDGDYDGAVAWQNQSLRPATQTVPQGMRLSKAVTPAEDAAYMDAVRRPDANERTTRLAPNGKRSNLTNALYHLVRTKRFKDWFGDWESAAEIKSFSDRIARWMTPENIEKAKGKTREQIFAEFGNNLEPIAYIPEGYLKHLDSTINDNRVYSGMGYMIDHAVNHHPEVDLAEYQGIQSVIDTADDVKLDDRNKGRNKSILFIKQVGKSGVVIVSFDEGDNGKIVLHKSFFNKMKAGRFDKLPSIKLSSEVGNPSISHASEEAPAVRLSALEDGDIKPNIVRPVNQVSKVVDENGEPMVVWHGAKNKHNVYNQVHTFHISNREVASEYGDVVDGNFVNAKNIIEIDADGGEWLSVETPNELIGKFNDGEEIDDGRGFTATFDEYSMSVRDIATFAKRAGYDGVIVRNVEDTNDGTGKLGTDIVTFSPSQIKSADPATYDDAGNVIPLSRRFDASNPDIRWSIGTLSDGRKFVDVDNVPVELANERDLKKKRGIAIRLIRERWVGRIIDEDGVRAFVNGVTAREYASPAKTPADQVFRDKLDAASELDKIVATSINPRIEEDGRDGHKHEGVKAWEYRDVILKVGDRFYSGKANIKILEKQNKNGENQRLLHDVTGLKDITDEVRALNDDKSREVSNIGESARIVSNGAESVKGGARFSKTASAGPGLNELSDEGVIEARKRAGLPDLGYDPGKQHWADIVTGLVGGVGESGVIARANAINAAHAANRDYRGFDAREHIAAAIVWDDLHARLAETRDAMRALEERGEQDGGRYAELERKANDITVSIDALDNAANLGGSEVARALAARRFMTGTSFSREFMKLNAALKKAGRKMTSEEEAHLRELVKKLNAASMKIEAAQSKKSDDAVLSGFMKREEKRAKPADPAAHHAELVEGAKRYVGRHSGAGDLDLYRLFQGLARANIDMGVRGVDGVTAATIADVRAIFGEEDARAILGETDESARSAAAMYIGGYNRHPGAKPAPDEAALAMRDIKAQSRTIAQMNEIAAGYKPAIEGSPEKRETSEEYRQRRIEMQNELRRVGVYLKDIEGNQPYNSMRTPLEQEKTRIENRIAEIEEAIRTGKPLRARGLVPIELDDETKSLQERLEKLQKDYHEIFVKKQWDKDEASLREALDEYLGRLAGRLIDTEGAAFVESLGISTKRGKTEAQRKAEYFAGNEDVQRLLDAIAISKARLRTYRRIAQLKERIKNGDIMPRQIDNSVYANDPEVQEAMREAAQYRQQIMQMRADAEFEAMDKMGKTLRVASDLFDVAKSIRASGDLSSVGVQLALGMLYDPTLLYKATRAGVKSIGGQGGVDRANAIMTDLMKSPFAKYYEAAGLALENVDQDHPVFANRNEMFANDLSLGTRRLAEKFRELPGGSAAAKLYDLHMKNSERMFAMPCNIVRASMFDSIAKAVVAANGGAELTEAQAKAIAETVNDMTGSGNVRGTGWTTAARNDLVKKFIWAPKRILGQISYAALDLPAAIGGYGKFKGLDRTTRRTIIAHAYARPAGVAAAIFGAAILATLAFGNPDDPDDKWNLVDKTTFDLRSSHFMKLRLGGKYVSLGGNIEQYYRVPAQIATQTKIGKYGEKKGINEGYGSETGGDLLSDMLIFNKLSPSFSMGAAAINRRERFGDKIEGVGGWTSFFLRNMLWPMTWEEMFEDFKEHPGENIAWLVPNALGYTGYSDKREPEKEYADVKSLYNKAVKAGDRDEAARLMRQYPYLRQKLYMDSDSKRIDGLAKQLGEAKSAGQKDRVEKLQAEIDARRERMRERMRKSRERE